MALSPLLWVPEVQVPKRSAKHAHHPPRCSTQLALFPLTSQLSPLHWYMAWNGVTSIEIMSLPSEKSSENINRPFS